VAAGPNAYVCAGEAKSTVAFAGRFSLLKIKTICFLAGKKKLFQYDTETAFFIGT
jgi:hypothetical protein